MMKIKDMEVSKEDLVYIEYSGGRLGFKGKAVGWVKSSNWLVRLMGFDFTLHNAVHRKYGMFVEGLLLKSKYVVNIKKLTEAVKGE